MTAPNLTPRQRKAVEALAVTGEVARAAEAAHVSRDTIYRWMRDQVNFRAALNEAEGLALQTLTRRLVSLAEAAANTLESVMDDNSAPHSARVMAAGKVIDSLIRLRELVTLEQRISALENKQDGTQQFIDAA